MTPAIRRALYYSRRLPAGYSHMITALLAATGPRRDGSIVFRLRACAALERAAKAGSKK